MSLPALALSSCSTTGGRGAGLALHAIQVLPILDLAVAMVGWSGVRGLMAAKENGAHEGMDAAASRRRRYSST